MDELRDAFGVAFQAVSLAQAPRLFSLRSEPPLLMRCVFSIKPLARAAARMRGQAKAPSMVITPMPSRRIASQRMRGRSVASMSRTISPSWSWMRPVRTQTGDAEVVGDEACVALDFGEFGDYAKRK